MSPQLHAELQVRGDLLQTHADILEAEALDAIAALRPFEARRKQLMSARMARRLARSVNRRPLAFLDPDAPIGGSGLTAAQARAGDFVGSEIPHDLRRQWIQGTGPAARPRSSPETNLRNVAYALLSGADGWMFDGEDALGQAAAMSLDNQRSLKAAIAREPAFLEIAAQVAQTMNTWARGFLGRRLFEDLAARLDHSTVIFRPRGLHLDDRHIRQADGQAIGASIVDAALYITHNHRALRARGASLVLYLPKIQTADEAWLWHEILSGLEQHLRLPAAAIKTYVLVEQLEAAFQLMEIRAALAPRFVGFNTGRWDYINSVADALAWDETFVNPNIQAIAMTYGYMRAYEDRVRRAVNTPDKAGRYALWQGGMEPNIPVGSRTGIDASMKRARAGAERELAAGASGKWVAHWKMVPIIRPVWEEAGQDNQLGRAFPPLTYTEGDARELIALDGGPRTVAGARDLLSVALQYGNAFLQGFQAAALKAADHFGDEDVLYLMEDMATGEIRVSILWEWLHKAGAWTEDDAASGVAAGQPLDRAFFERLLEEEMDKLLAADDRDVHDDSKDSTLPVARAIVSRCVLEDAKSPWFIDLLNLCLGAPDLAEAERRIGRYFSVLDADHSRLTENPDFSA